MSEDPYKQAFDSAIQELSDLMRDREELDAKRERMDARINKLRDGVIGLGTLCGKSRTSITTQHPELFPDLLPPDMGLTDAVRNVLSSRPVAFFTAVNVRDGLVTKGYDLSNYKNVLASIHTILKRLKESREVLTGSRDGKTTYRWRGGTPQISDEIPGTVPGRYALPHDEAAKPEMREDPKPKGGEVPGPLPRRTSVPKERGALEKILREITDGEKKKK